MEKKLTDYTLEEIVTICANHTSDTKYGDVCHRDCPFIYWPDNEVFNHCFLRATPKFWIKNIAREKGVLIMLELISKEEVLLTIKDTIEDRISTRYDWYIEHELKNVSEELAYNIKNLKPVAFKSQWVSVENRLPEPNTKVLAIWETDDGDCYQDVMEYSDEDDCWVIDEREILAPVTHWQPLPTTPQEKRRRLNNENHD